MLTPPSAHSMPRLRDSVHPPVFSEGSMFFFRFFKKIFVLVVARVCAGGEQVPHCLCSGVGVEGEDWRRCVAGGISHV